MRTTKVRVLLLLKNMLAGAIPDGVAKWSDAILLIVSSNQLSGAIPTAMSQVGYTPHSYGEHVGHRSEPQRVVSLHPVLHGPSWLGDVP